MQKFAFLCPQDFFSEQITKINSLKMEDYSNNTNSASLHVCNIFILFSYGMQIR